MYLAGKCSYKKRVLHLIYMFVKFQLSGSISFSDMRGPKYTLEGATPPSGKIVIPEKSTWP